MKNLFQVISKLFLCILFLFSIRLATHAQVNQITKVQFGAELDILPYITGGYFAAGWVGKDLWRVRALTAYVIKPDWSTKKNFSNHRIHAYAFVVDRFLKKDWKSWWAGSGLVLWNSTIQTDAKIQTAQFTNLLLNGSIGYNFSLGKHFYLSPWGSLNVSLAGDKTVLVDNLPYSLPVINPEASLKFGYIF
ncbi:MAG: hypothetical protein Q8K64_01020 [Sediminibacterium sp.]|nr:hypothetical protein [Sediminibacterium sp.]